MNAYAISRMAGDGVSEISLPTADNGKEFIGLVAINLSRDGFFIKTTWEVEDNILRISVIRPPFREVLDLNFSREDLSLLYGRTDDVADMIRERYRGESMKGAKTVHVQKL